MQLKKNEQLKQASFIISLPQHQETTSRTLHSTSAPVSLTKAQSSCKKIKTRQTKKKEKKETMRGKIAQKQQNTFKIIRLLLKILYHKNPANL